MKKLRFLIVLVIGVVCCSTHSNAQIVVTDPPHIVVQGWEFIKNLARWKQQVKQFDDAQDLRKGLQKMKALKELQALKELASMADDVACLQSEFNFYINLSSNYDCLKFLNFQSVNMDFRIGTDLLDKVITVQNYFDMNSEGRLAFVKQARDVMEESSQKMKEYNAMASRAIRKQAKEDYMKDNFANGKRLCFNRYAK